MRILDCVPETEIIVIIHETHDSRGILPRDREEVFKGVSYSMSYFISNEHKQKIIIIIMRTKFRLKGLKYEMRVLFADCAGVCTW
jgi:hypothetical protein